MVRHKNGRGLQKLGTQTLLYKNHHQESKSLVILKVPIDYQGFDSYFKLDIQVRIKFQ